MAPAFPVTRQKNIAFHNLKAVLGVNVRPTLEELGFRAFRSKNKFPERYSRRRGGGFDVIEFQFDKYARPAFRIHFRPIDDPDDLAAIEEDQEEMWMWNAAYSASPGPRSYDWFKLSLFERLFSPARGTARVCRDVKGIVLEIDEFLCGGEPSRHIFEGVLWADPIAARIGRKPPLRRINR